MSLTQTRGTRVRTVIAVAAAVATLLAGCSGASEGTGSDGPPSSPRHGGRVVLALTGAGLTNLNTQLTSASNAQFLTPLWADGLFAWDGEGEMVPRMATSWELSEDRKTYTFKLRKGVKWSDGQPFGADDVVFNLTEMAKFNTYLTSILPIMDKVEKVDDSTVEVHLKYPYTPFLKSIDISAFPLVPKHVYEKGNPATNPANVKPVGLGPYTLKEWKRDRSLTFVRNPHYWEKPKPYLDEVVVALMQDERQQVNALLKGEVQFVQVPLSQLGRVRKNAKQADVRTLQLDVSAPGRMVIEFNMKREPFDDPKVRKALFTAIDRKSIARDAQGGAAEPEVSAIPKQFKDLYNPSVDYTKMYAYDPAKAGRLLDEAGYPMKGGKRFDVELSFVGASPQYPFPDVARIIAANWQAVGVNVKLNSLDQQVWLERIYRERNFDASLAQLTATSDPSSGIDRSHTCNNEKLNYVNPTGYCNPELDAIAERANKAPAEERKKIYGEYERIVAEDLNMLTMTAGSEVFAVSNNLGGLDKEFSIAYEMYPNWANVWTNGDS